MARGRAGFPMRKPGRKAWYEEAREEGRLCRLCREPVSRAQWRNKQANHLCVECELREIANTPGNSPWKLGH